MALWATWGWGSTYVAGLMGSRAGLLARVPLPGHMVVPRRHREPHYLHGVGRGPSASGIPEPLLPELRMSESLGAGRQGRHMRRGEGGRCLPHPGTVWGARSPVPHWSAS